MAKQQTSSSIFQKVKIFPHSVKNSKTRSSVETLNSTSKAIFLEKSMNDSETQNVNLENVHPVETNSVFEENNFSDLSLNKTNPSSQTLLNGYSKIQELKLVKIGLASSEKIVEWAEKILPNGKIFGEVLNANTLHYRTFKPHKGGLFCERIFGPLKDFECACGIRQKPFEDSGYVQNLLDKKQSKKLFCPNCDVEYTWSVLRRYQLGYIQLVSPVSHFWYLKTNPSYLSLLLDIKKRDLEAMIYCMQITTLEYYWRPLHSLQLNMTASNLLKSYKQFLSLSSKPKQRSIKESLDSQRILLQFTGKNQKKEFIKRKQFAKRSVATSLNFSNFIPMVKDTDPVEKKIEYLENSFKLSSENVQKTQKTKKTKVQTFLKQKRSKNIEKQHFFMDSELFLKDFYRKLYVFLSKTNVKSLLKVQKPILFLENTHSIEIPKIQDGTSLAKSVDLKPNKIFIGKSSANFIFFLKTYLQKHHKKERQKHLKEFFAIEISVSKLQQLSIYDKTTQEKNKMPVFEKNRQFLENLEMEHKVSEKSIFFRNFLNLLQPLTLKQAWGSLYQSENQYADFMTYFSARRKNHPDSWRKRHPSSTDFIQPLVFLHFLSLLQKPPQTEFEKLGFENLKVEEMDELFDFLRTQKLSFQTLLTKEKNVAEAMKSPFFVERLTPFSVLDRGITNTLEFQHLKTQMSFESSTRSIFSSLSGWLFEFTVYSLKRVSDEYFVSNFKKEKSPKRALIFKSSSSVEKTKMVLKQSFFHKNKNLFSTEEKIPEKKVHQFCQNSDFFPMNSVFYQKNLITFSKKLLLSHGKKWPFSLNLFNNIYTVSYSTGWQTEKDWKYFLYYNIAAIEISDHLLKIYKYRFLENAFLNFSNSMNIPILGAHFVKKLIFQYEGLEMKKMAKQHQNLLPKLNKYIRLLKPFVSQKSEFLKIQKLLKKRDLIIRRLKLFRKLVKKNSKPSSMILTTLPVLPPDLRPILKMQNQIAASDLNRFYQRILYRNERFKKFLKANQSMARYEPGFELKYAQRLLQEAVDNLIQNGKGNVKPETNSRGQALKSLSEILKGKQGRFRQYLLGKRVDYSGRSVIVVGPTLKIHQCGLPYEMALELFLPFLIKRIFQYQLARTVIGAKTILKTQKKVTWNLLEEIMQNHPILLNRAPTLHRLGIQAFQPKLIEGRAILLHPLVCPAFNADFDGDQMAVHVPITVESRTEAWKLMFSRNHLISPATGEPMLLPSQDMVLGCYYLTTESLQYRKFHYGRPFHSGTCFYFSTMQEVLKAYAQEKIHLQTPIWLKWNGAMEMDHQLSKPLEIRMDKKGFFMEMYSKFQKYKNFENFCESLFVRTTAGRVLMNTLIETSIQS